MAVIRELIDTNAGSFDSDGNGEKTRPFHVEGGHPTGGPAATASALGLPGVGAAHPSDPALFLDRYDASRFGETNDTLAVAIYTTNKWGTIRPRPETVPVGDVSWSSRLQTVEIKVPYGRRKTYADAANPTTTYTAWDIETFTITHRWVVRNLRVTVEYASQSQMADAIAACEAEAGYIHRIRGVSCLYNGAPSSQVPNTLTWTFNHEWIIDRGTNVIPAPSVDASNFSMPPELTGGGGPSGKCRFPFYELKAFPATNPKTTPPIFTTVLKAEGFHDSGYATLPGVPGAL